MTGLVIDYVTGDEFALADGEFTMALIDGDGPPAPLGDKASSLPVGTNVFMGEQQCTSSVREVALTLDYDGLGQLSGELEVGDPGLDLSLGTFEVVGTHNPSTGGITLAPRLWTEGFHNILTYWVNGVFDPQTGDFDGDVLINLGECPMSYWHMSLQ